MKQLSSKIISYDRQTIELIHSVLQSNDHGFELDDYSLTDFKGNLSRWIQNAVPLKIELWQNGSFYLGPDADWSSCMIMQRIKVTNEIKSIFSIN